MKKEIPILFSTPMVQAILEGRKTQTRRIVKGLSTEPNKHNPSSINFRFSKGKVYAGGTNTEAETLSCDFLGIGSYCPYGKVGDIIWVRETWWRGETWDEKDEDNTRKKTILFRADSSDNRPCDVSDAWCINEYGHDKRDWPSWKPSIHMPKDVCRIWLEVTDVKVERLHDISAEDAAAEGVRKGIFRDGPNTEKGEFQLEISLNGSPIGGYQDGFKYIWYQINGAESWNQNPWVWVIYFKVLSTTGKPDNL